MRCFDYFVALSLCARQRKFAQFLPGLFGLAHQCAQLLMPLSILAVASLIWADRAVSACLAMAVNTVLFLLAIKNICDTADRFSRVCGIDISVSYGAMLYGLCMASLWVLLLSYRWKSPKEQSGS